MSRQKLKRFSANLHMPNILEDNKPVYHDLKGQWNETFFKNDRPITVEVGCGYGEYSVGLAKLYPNRNFIGVDVKGDRLWVGGKQALDHELKNVAFLRAQIQNIADFFAPNEVENVWITFPDPRPKDRDIKRRLTSPRFLEAYKQIIQPGGMVYLKTDNTGLFEYTLEVLNERKDILDMKYTSDLYRSSFMDEHHGIKTRFEQKFHNLGEDIKYLKFRFA